MTDTTATRPTAGPRLPCLPRSPRPPRVALLGERGSFGEEAAARMFGEECELVFRPTFDGVFAALGAEADCLLVPVENSSAGAVEPVQELLTDYRPAIVAEVTLPISLCLVGGRGASFARIETVESHPMALRQCARFFAAHTRLGQTPGGDTAGCVRRIIESGDPRRAAIGSRRAADVYGGVILRERIEDEPDNRTRFALLVADDTDRDRPHETILRRRIGI